MKRRSVLSLAFAGAGCAIGPVASTVARAENSLVVEDGIEELDYRSLGELDPKVLFGNLPATTEQIERANQIVAGTPHGPRPIDIAQSFVDRFSTTDADLISAWPERKAWNPLIVMFYSATSYRMEQLTDAIPWCAAFANWCIERNAGNGSRSADSQSFLSRDFRRVQEPRRGDLAVYTKYDLVTARPLGGGHVGFFAGRGDGDRILLLGGNQGGGRHIISISSWGTSIPVKNAGTVTAVMRLNAFVSVA